MTPLFNQILVKPDEKAQILLGEGRLEQYGEVLAVGKDVQEIKVGDRIAYLIWGINSLEIDGVKHYFVPEDKDFLLAKI